MHFGHRLHFESLLLHYCLAGSNYVHKRGTLKSCSTQNIIFIQQNWAEKINVLHYFLGTLCMYSLFVSPLSLIFLPRAPDATPLLHLFVRLFLLYCGFFAFSIKPVCSLLVAAIPNTSLVTELVKVLHVSQSWLMLSSPVRVTSSRACASLWL
jgi:hypothetical protein